MSGSRSCALELLREEALELGTLGVLPVLEAAGQPLEISALAGGEVSRDLYEDAEMQVAAASATDGRYAPFGQLELLA